jgi:hypothetical protein
MPIQYIDTTNMSDKQILTAILSTPSNLLGSFLQRVRDLASRVSSGKPLRGPLFRCEWVPID